MDLQHKRFSDMTNDKPLTLTIGNFDGLHRGHQLLIMNTKYPDTESALLTFAPHPMKVLRNMKDHVIIMSLEKKIEIVKSLGIDHMFIAEFDKEMAQTSKEAFIDQLKRLNVKRLVLGVDFRFGSHASGHVEDLRKEFEVIVLDDVVHQETRISTTYIKDLLYSGELARAELLLGRPYSIEGVVVHGDKVGRTLGMPTANLDLESYVLPPNGVYYVDVIHKGIMYPGALNIGYNPTINYSIKKRVEVYILNFNQTLYGDKLEIIFRQYLRPEKQFESKEKLIVQLMKDIEDVKRFSNKSLISD
ncbi:riboflavin kinase/FMN adenylyltransferase [Acholeplasma morum]|uniref:bifunctional riboflavin kinase/FAD synthetase n=1 Tax=Paracholeplasma morum TaxID=264637 RepID=UPI00195E9C9B|nr:bifunctional riboflavin kinase/FAD synthetase [Paracholeplasma morum]MBM7453216.1 riboflavin kinase/FMN adenylyltransferase [Paracholeplasma morum]